jgi:hypothetical protein
MVVAISDESRRTSIISLGLRVVNLRCGGRQRFKGARLSEAELCGVPVADGFRRGRRCARLLSLCRSWILIVIMAGVVIVIGVYVMVDFATDLRMDVLVPSLPCRAGPGRLEEPRDARADGGARHWSELLNA